MTCRETNNQLDEYIAGELAAERHAAIAHHIAGCNDCRSQLALRHALATRTRALPRELQPQRELWPGIAEQIRNKNIHPLHRATPAWKRQWMAWGAAACLAVVAIGGAVWGIPGLGNGSTPTTIAPPMIGENLTHLSITTGGNHQYQQVRQQLQQTLHLRKEDLSPETVLVIEKNMVVIDEAVAEINKALSEDPENPNLKLMLVATQKQAADLLESIAETRTQQSPRMNEPENQRQ